MKQMYKILCEGMNNKPTLYTAIRINKIKEFMVYFTTIKNRSFIIPIKRIISIEII